jgi:IclR family acetate operon transcriptional repressor
MEMLSAGESPIDAESLGKPKDRYEEYFIRAVGNAIDILELINQSPEPISLVRVSEVIGQSKSSVFRILCTLEHKGLLERRPGNVYALSNSGFSLKSNRTLVRLKCVAEPLMRELGKEFRETVSLAFLFENHIEVIAVVDSPQRIRMYNVLGSIIPPYASSVGKCIVAHQPEARREHLVATYGIHAFTPRTIIDATELDEEFNRVLQQGFAVDREESTPDGCCFGAPIWTAKGKGHVEAALSLSLPKVRLTDESKIIEALRRTARLISNQLSGE